MKRVTSDEKRCTDPETFLADTIKMWQIWRLLLKVSNILISQKRKATVL